MKRASLLVCALGGLTLLATGCDTMMLKSDIQTAAVDAVASVRVMDGTPDVVAVNLQAMLKGRGFDAKIVGNGDDVVVQSKTASGMDFALMLKRQRVDGRDQTKIALQWMGSNKDGTVHTQIIADLDKQPGVKK